jgi:putative hydrolase of the HAD superfamily
LLEAVLFDWGDTLMRWSPDEQLLFDGHAAGLRELGRAPVAGMTERFRDVYLPAFFAPGLLDEVDYAVEVRRLLGDFEIDVTDEDLTRFLAAEHAAWEPARALASTTHALLESLRDRGLRLGIVSNAIDPPDLLHHDLERLGVAERVDAAVFSCEVGRRKPDPAIFERVLGQLDVAAARSLMVGDTLATDIAGARALGMHTCQAVWFRADDGASAPGPDFVAVTQMDVLTVIARLSA